MFVRYKLTTLGICTASFHFGPNLRSKLRAQRGIAVDFHVDRVGVKELWDLKWHQEFQRGAYPGPWPDWMSR